jgi:hypothetical protein
MKKSLSLLLLGPLFLASAIGAGGFEGKVTLRVSDQKNPATTMTFSLKEGFSRLDMTAEGTRAGVIYDVGKRQITILMLDQKMYMTQAMPNPGAAAAGRAENAAGETLEITTAREKILGYDCVKYLARSKAGTSEIWVTDQLGAFLGFGGPPAGGSARGPGGAAPAPQGWEEAIAGKGVFPLRVITTSAGRESFRLEATAVEKMPLPPALFSPPPDFSNLSEMMRSMGLPDGIPGLPGGR